MHNIQPRRSVLKLSVAALLIAAALAEGAARLLGVVDVPTYAVDQEIGYLPKPGQSGNFLIKKDWVFNDRSMGVAASWDPAKKPNLLLIGNSIVMGGNPYQQKEKLGPLVQQRIGERFSLWPIAAGGWTNVNESVYLARNPDVAAAANFFVWEYMSGGLSGLSGWRGDYVFPSERPWSASWYAFRRYLVPRFTNVNMNELPPTGAVRAEHLAQFEAAVGKLSKATGKALPGIVFLYPTKKEYLAAKQGQEWLPERATLERICAQHGLTLLDVARQPQWNDTLYREGTHPTVEGNAVLADLLAAAILQNTR